ncbi:hypothetical protein [Methylovulum miyakonense]|uniref:hypothetical protein n=1 Tax=Methylovulum miyakonense TaxID=645578 RepID=UPI00037C4F58|nr:hypothetical protein [Methylovulum miyakonense]
MKRSWQIFVAPGQDTDTLPLENSPWHDERWVTLPKEHWDLILDFGEHLDANNTERLRSFSCSENNDPNDYIYALPEELETLVKFIENLADQISHSPPLVPEATEEIPDEYVNEEHVRMLKAVASVFRESLRLHQHFRAWIE